MYYVETATNTTVVASIACNAIFAPLQFGSLYPGKKRAWVYTGVSRGGKGLFHTHMGNLPIYIYIYIYIVLLKLTTDRQSRAASLRQLSLLSIKALRSERKALTLRQGNSVLADDETWTLFGLSYITMECVVSGT